MSDREQLEQRAWTQEERLNAARKIYDLQNRAGRPYFHSSEAHKESWCAGEYGAYIVNLDLAVTLQCTLTAALASLKHKDEQIREARELLSRISTFGLSLPIVAYVKAWLTRNALPDTGAETK